MGRLVQLFPFDNKKFYQKIVPELRKGLKSEFLCNEFLEYKKTLFNFDGLPNIDIIDNFTKISDVEFKYHSDSIHYQNMFSIPWYEETERFFEFIIGNQCLDLTHFYSIGTYYPDIFFDKTQRNSIAFDVINKLADNKIFWKHYDGGICGWISNEDVELLLWDLPSLKINEDLTFKELDNFIQFLNILKSSNKGILCGVDLVLKIPPYKTRYGIQSDKTT
jgi:hypothetical protein